MEFWRYYRVFRRRRWLVVAAMLAAIAAAIATTRPDENYQATATLSVPSDQRSFFVSGIPEQSGPGVRIALALNLIRSRDLAERVIQRFHLSMRPDELLSRLRIAKDPASDLIRLTVTGKTPQEAIALANAVAETAEAYDQEVQGREATLAREFVERQVEGARASLRRAEDALLAFKQRNEFILASSKAAQVAGLENEGQQLDLSLNEVDARLGFVRAQMGQQSATRSDKEITDNPIAQQLRAQLVGLEVALTSELAVHTDSHPNVITLKAKIEAVKDRLNTELTKIVSSERVEHNPIYDSLTQDRISLETEKIALLAKREALQRGLGLARQEIPGLAQIQLEQSRLARTVDILGKEDADLQSRLAQARLREQEVQDLGSLAVVNHASKAQPASLQSKLARLSLASVLGLVGGGSLVAFLEYTDNRLNTPENAERVLGMPALVAIPRHNPPFEEAYRLLRASLSAQERGEGANVIVVTSPKPGEGTSTVVANLARAFVRAGRRTIVVDAALQRPTQHVHFRVRNKEGLAEILTGKATPQDVLVETAIPNLLLVPSGGASKTTDGVSDLGAMARLLADLKRRADVILIDTPPVGVFADALDIAPLASGVLLVLDARQSPRGVEERVKVQLERMGARIFGFVLTRVRPDLVDSYVYQERLQRIARRRVLAPIATAAAVLLGVAMAGLLAGISMRLIHAGHLPLAITVRDWISSLLRIYAEVTSRT